MKLRANNSPPPVSAAYQRVPVRTHYLEMTSPPAEPISDMTGPLSCTPWFTPNVDEYLSLYEEVGGPWGWTGRLMSNRKTLASLLSSPRLRLYRVNGIPDLGVVGFFELDVTNPKSVEIVYLGLTPDSLGKGYGAALLGAAIRYSWQGSPERVWLHTCEYDHPRALEAYRRAGFIVYDERIEWQCYPTAFLRAHSPR